MIKTRTRRIGALWVRKTKEGKTYLSGILETLAGDVGIVAFQNDKKTKDNQPDYNLCISGDREEEGGGKANKVGEVPIVVLDDG